MINKAKLTEPKKPEIEPAPAIPVAPPSIPKILPKPDKPDPEIPKPETLPPPRPPEITPIKDSYINDTVA